MRKSVLLCQRIISSKYLALEEFFNQKPASCETETILAEETLSRALSRHAGQSAQPHGLTRRVALLFDMAGTPIPLLVIAAMEPAVCVP